MGDKVDAIIQVKRGTEAQRTAVTFREGELAYSTDVKRLYVGDGATAGGTAASSKLYLGNPNNIGTLITGLVPGDYFLDTTAAIAPKLYALTGTNANTFDSYGLICDNGPAVNAFTVVKENSTFWGQQGGIVLQDAFTVLNTNSANWRSVFTTVYTQSGGWGGGAAGDVGENLSILESVFQGNSGKWDSTYTTVRINSGDWRSAYTTVNNNSLNWDSAYNTVRTNSGTWSPQDNTAQNQKVDSTYTTVNTNSANWIKRDGDILSNTDRNANNEFLKININGTIRYIRLWQ